MVIHTYMGIWLVFCFILLGFFFFFHFFINISCFTLQPQYYVSLSKVLCLPGIAQSLVPEYTAVFTNIEIAWDEVSIESGMCLWQISTPDNIGCFFPKWFLPTCFSLCFFSFFFLIAILCHSSSKRLCVCVFACALRRLVFIPVAVCVCRYTIFTSPWFVSWNVKWHMSKKHNKALLVTLPVHNLFAMQYPFIWLIHIIKMVCFCGSVAVNGYNVCFCFCPLPRQVLLQLDTFYSYSCFVANFNICLGFFLLGCLYSSSW